MVDVHCHVDLYSNPQAILAECESKGIYTIAVTNLPRHFLMGYPYVKNYSKIRLALGMHPLYADEHDSQMQSFAEYLTMTSYIGEIGLDFSKDGIGTKEKQIESFKKILAYLKGHHKILSLHSRKAEKEVLQYLKKYEILHAIFHWYTGPVELIPDIIKAGYFFSVNIAMTQSSSGRKIIESIPVSHMLTESDGPFTLLSSQPVRPINMVQTIDQIAKIKSTNPDVLRVTLDNNFFSLIRNLR